MDTPFTCEFCAGRPQRLRLAQALRSGTHLQHHDPHEEQPLRSNSDHYSVTGLAVDTGPETIWAKIEGTWHAVWVQHLMHHLPNIQWENDELTNLTEQEQNILLNHNATDRTSCPEITSHNLGLWNGNEHPAMITVSASMIPPEGRRALGLNSLREIPLDRFTFEHAARILTEFETAVGQCRCGDLD